MTIDCDVAVVGAGIGGLVTASLLSSKGLNVLVVDKGSGIGGRLSPSFFRGCVIDNGPHIFLSGTSNSIVSFLGEINKPVDFTNLGLVETHIDGLKFDLGITFKSLLKNLEGKISPSELSELEAIYNRAYSANPDEFDSVSAADWIGKAGELVLKIISCCVTIPLTISDLSKLSAGEFIRTVQLECSGDFVYPEKGLAAILDALYRNLLENGVKLLLNNRVEKISVENGKANGLYAISELTGKMRFIKCKSVVSNLPFQRTLQILDESHLSDKTVSRIQELKNSSTSGISLIAGLKRPIFPSKNPMLYYREKGARYLLSPSNITGELPYLFYGNYVDGSLFEDRNNVLEASRELVSDILSKYPEFKGEYRWIATSTLQHVDGMARMPGMTGKFAPPVKSEDIDGLYHVGDSIRGEENGAARAISTAKMCTELILK
jgi:phytoene dehydrogenase-like protein